MNLESNQREVQHCYILPKDVDEVRVMASVNSLEEYPIVVRDRNELENRTRGSVALCKPSRMAGLREA